MKFGVFAEGYTDGFGAVAVGLGSDATDGGGYPTAGPVPSRPVPSMFLSD